MDKKEVTREEYIRLTNRLQHLGMVISHMHGSVQGLKLLEEYGKIKEKLQNVVIISQEVKHR